MELVPAAAPAPAQPAAVAPPTTQIASEAAISKSTSDYRAARQAERLAERAGKPLPEVPRTAPASSPELTAAPTAAPAPPQLSKRQIEANERTQKAVEAATADLRRQYDELKAQVARPAAPTQPQAPPPAAVEPPAAPVEKFQSLQAWSEQNPDKSIEDYMRALYKHEREQETKAAQVEEQFKRQSEYLNKQNQAFKTRMAEANAAEPDLASKIPAPLRDPNRDTRPLSALQSHEMKDATFTNVVAEAMFQSEQPAELAKYLHANQADAVRIAALPVVDALLALAVIDGRISGSKTTAARATTAPAQPKPKTLTDAPAPMETLGTRPAEATDAKTAAIKRGDTRSYREIRRQERAASLVRR